MTAPLHGLAPIESTQLIDELQVVELSRGVAGAYCGRLLAQLGARVTRFGPQTEAAGSPQTRALLHATLHRGKVLRSLNDDTLAAALAAADLVVVERADRGDLLDAAARDILEHRKGLADHALVVVLSANGLQEPADSGCALTSAAAAAMSWAIGEPGRAPLAPAYDIVDYQAGAHAAAAALAAWVAGAGAAAGPLDVASRDVAAHLVSTLAQNYVPFGRPWQRDGRRPFMSGGIYPLGLFECNDGLIALYCRSAEQWHGILRAMGDPAWGREERFRDPRVVARHHGNEADSHLLPWLARHTKAELMKLGIEYGFPAAPVGTVGEALANPQFAYRGSLEPLRVDDTAAAMVPAAPWRVYEAAARPVVRRRTWPVGHGAAAPPSHLLRGLRVLDLSWVWSGPQVTSVLADLGAEVIKVEHPSRLDSVRQRGRPLLDGKEVPGPVEELNPWFNQLNHGKRSQVLDIKNPDDRARLLALAARCDVVVENMRPGALPKLGLGYAEFAAVNPSVVMLSMSLAGQQGPLSGMKGYAGIMTSMAGLESLVGYEEPDGRQLVIGMAKTALGDPNAAVHALVVLMAALSRRRRTGHGAWIDLSQTDAVLSLLAGPLIEAQLHGQAPVLGNHHPLHVPHGHFPCGTAGDWVAIAVQSEAQWRALAAACGAALGRFTTLDLAGRQAQRPAIEQALAQWTRERVREQVVDALGRAGVPCAAVNSYQEMVAAPWRRARGLTRVISHPYIERQEIATPPWRFGAASACAERGAPLLGADTAEVLRELELAQPADVDAAAAP